MQYVDEIFEIPMATSVSTSCWSTGDLSEIPRATKRVLTDAVGTHAAFQPTNDKQPQTDIE